MINDLLLLVLRGRQRLSETIRKQLHGNRVFKNTPVDMTFIALDGARSLASPQTPGVVYISQFNLCIVCSPGLHIDQPHQRIMSVILSSKTPGTRKVSI